MTHPSTSPTAVSHPERLALIRRARKDILFNGETGLDDPARMEGWIERSWRRCLAMGQRPHQSPDFSAVPPTQLRRVLDANRMLLQAALPVLDQLSRAIAATRSFAILTNADGLVLDARGAMDRSHVRADAITRIGCDLSENAQGTTAIGAVLAEQRSVWLHRGEHFFDANTEFSCAGAPLFGPDGRCVGVLDLTGVQTDERPELRHLVSQFARHIENALTLGQLDALNASQRAGSLLVRLNWAGCPLGSDNDGLVSLDSDGFVLGANQTARQMVPQLQPSAGTDGRPLHSSELFAMAFDRLFDAARASTGHATHLLEVPLWSGLRLQAVAQQAGQLHQPIGAIRTAETPRPLKEVETALIRQAMLQAHGNVMKAARALGVSRATVYRRLGNSAGKSGKNRTAPG
jgi:transcriptional regulator of acetoin/glycerol metabolism